MTELRPSGAVPSQRQLAWHGREFYGFVHFTVNTFTGLEWGYGDEEEAIFDPTDFSADQIVSTAAEAGMSGLILTCKHHDGFCLWPSPYSDHTVARSPFRGGSGDVVRELSDACRAHDIDFGVYLSPWDRNHESYGRPEYIEYYRKQLRELLTSYGELFEVWFDGANGGDGYYGGAREHREIDRRTYYDWERTWEIVRELQPGACLFSDAGPDIRWVGNEKGIAGDPCWHAFDRTRHVPGDVEQKVLPTGEPDAALWTPAECDVSIRPGWFYHAEEDDRVKSADELFDLYLKSVGRGAALLLNLPPDRRGLIHERDREALIGFRDRRDRIFSTNLADPGSIEASSTLGADDRADRSAGCGPGSGRDIGHDAERTLDGSDATYWAAAAGVHEATVSIRTPEEVKFNLIDLGEYLPLGQRIAGFRIEVGRGGSWESYAEGEAVGNRRIVTGPAVRTDRVRIVVTGREVEPTLRKVGLHYDAP